MKGALQFLSIVLLTWSFLYPLLFGGLGRHVAWGWVACMALGGVVCLYLLVKYRRQL
jgi:hypothetical protein